MILDYLIDLVDFQLACPDLVRDLQENCHCWIMSLRVRNGFLFGVLMTGLQDLNPFSWDLIDDLLIQE